MPVIGAGAATAAASRITGLRDDPYFGFNFHVEIQGLIAGGFTGVSGLSITTEIEEIRQGGVNDRSYKLPKQSSYSDLRLMRGLADVDMLWPWYQDVVAGKIQRRNGTIYLMSRASIPVMYWNFYQAYPIAWEGPSFDAASNTVLTTAITLVHEGLDNPVGTALGRAPGKLIG